MDEDLTTEQVLAHLQRLGLEATADSLAQDVRSCYVTGLKPARSKKAGRRWTLADLRRVCYLYRLKRRGAEGDTLRVLLFVRYGSGWPSVRQICLKGFAKLVGAHKSIVRDRIYKREPAPEEVSSYGEDFAEDAKFKNECVLMYILGLGYFGKPTRGSSLRPLFDAYSREFPTVLPPDGAAGATELAETLLGGAALSWEAMESMVREATEDEAARAAAHFRQFIAEHRSEVFRRWVMDKTVSPSTNLLTAGGRAQSELSEVLRATRGRTTPPQLLAAHLAPFLVLQRVYADLESYLMACVTEAFQGAAFASPSRADAELFVCSSSSG